MCEVCGELNLDCFDACFEAYEREYQREMLRIAHEDYVAQFEADDASRRDPGCRCSDLQLAHVGCDCEGWEPVPLQASVRLDDVIPF